MNRRDFLKQAAITLAAPLLPNLPSPTQQDRVAELEAQLAAQQAHLDAWDALSDEWIQAFDQWEECYREVVGYWREEATKRAYWEDQYEDLLSSLSPPYIAIGEVVELDDVFNSDEFTIDYIEQASDA